jgi:hypothetical protein
MSIAYNNRKKEKKRQFQRDIVEMEFGNVPEHLWNKYPGRDKNYILEASKALWDYKKLVKRMIRGGQISRFILAKDGNGKVLANGTYKFKNGKQLVVKGVIQKFVGYELQRQAEERHRGK